MTCPECAEKDRLLADASMKLLNAYDDNGILQESLRRVTKERDQLRREVKRQQNRKVDDELIQAVFRFYVQACRGGSKRVVLDEDRRTAIRNRLLDVVDDKPRPLWDFAKALEGSLHDEYMVGRRFPLDLMFKSDQRFTDLIALCPHERHLDMRGWIRGGRPIPDWDVGRAEAFRELHRLELARREKAEVAKRTEESGQVVLPLVDPRFVHEDRADRAAA